MAVKIYSTKTGRRLSIADKYREFMIFTYPSFPHVKIWGGLVNYFHQMCNVIKWIPVIWRDRYWDWCFLFKIIEFKLRMDSKKYNKWGSHVNSDRDAKRMLVCAELLKRMIDNNYEDTRTEIGEHSVDNMVNYEDYMRDQDLKYMFKIMEKHVFKWWD